MQSSNQAFRQSIRDRLDRIAFLARVIAEDDAVAVRAARERLGLPDPDGHPLGVPKEPQ